MQPVTTSLPASPANAVWIAPGVRFAFGACNSSASRECHPDRRTIFGGEGSRSGFAGKARFMPAAFDVYSLSPHSDDDRTSAGAPPPSDPGGSGKSDDDSGGPNDSLGADIVYYAIARIVVPANNSVSLKGRGLRQALVGYGIIKWMSDEQWDGIRRKAKEFEGLGETVKKVEKAIEDREKELVLLEEAIDSRFNRTLSFLCERTLSLISRIDKIGFLSSLFKKIASPLKKFVDRQRAKREQHKDIKGELKDLRGNKRAFEASSSARGCSKIW